MKRIMLAVIVLVVCALPLNALRQDEPHDGYWWAENSRAFKLGYLMGLQRGYANCHVSFQALLESYPKDSLLSDAQKIIWRWRYSKCLEVFEYVTSGMTFGQMIEGTDRLYKDYRNKNITVENLIYLVKMQIEGKSETKIDSVTREFRQRATKE